MPLDLTPADRQTDRERERERERAITPWSVILFLSDLFLCDIRVYSIILCKESMISQSLQKPAVMRTTGNAILTIQQFQRKREDYLIFAYTSIARQGSLLWSPNRALDVSPRTAILVSVALGGGAAIGGSWKRESIYIQCHEHVPYTEYWSNWHWEEHRYILHYMFMIYKMWLQALAPTQTRFNATK